MVQDVAAYLKWLRDPQRSYMGKDDVFRYVVERIDVTCSSSFAATKPDPPEQDHVSSETGPTTEEPISLKNKTRGAIVSFWLRGEVGHFRHLNSAMLVTLRAMQAEGAEKERAVEIVTEYVEALPIDLCLANEPSHRGSLAYAKKERRTVWS